MTLKKLVLFLLTATTSLSLYGTYYVNGKDGNFYCCNSNPTYSEGKKIKDTQGNNHQYCWKCPKPNFMK